MVNNLYNMWNKELPSLHFSNSWVRLSSWTTHSWPFLLLVKVPKWKKLRCRWLEDRISTWYPVFKNLENKSIIRLNFIWIFQIKNNSISQKFIKILYLYLWSCWDNRTKCKNIYIYLNSIQQVSNIIIWVILFDDMSYRNFVTLLKW